ncbi:threonylcarbamoyl-AMP synthase [bacterium]|jgi:L-threonylcarbamoyladenylate synthase|nr:threonylcarbamoyl-AMP synthase [bacterium]MBT4122039.1 threonylcarbamoyl-AMP synthase [bacterium]MBT4495215.1 threonylcarbamoyl-AMP synthase [bacterium]MBT4763549.1 threonylcarbamoyl-AMP synthase [bacterium]MBT5400920.1 threonylcarbamoyl-AMP synthase [bacterium]
MKRLVLDKNNQAEIIKQAISILKKGGVIVYPTETAYALGADFLNKKATNKIYKIKGRGSSKELPIIVSSLSMAKEYVKFNKLALKLARKYWPGPLTLVLETKQGKTLALRKTSNKFTLSLVKKLKVPIISTSANISGKTNCFKVDDIIKQFKNNRIKPDLIIDAGSLKKSKVSTIVSVDNKLKILRRGAIKL